MLLFCCTSIYRYYRVCFYVFTDLIFRRLELLVFLCFQTGSIFKIPSESENLSERLYEGRNEIKTFLQQTSSRPDK